MNVRTIVLGAMRFMCMLMLGIAGVQRVAVAGPNTKQAEKKMINITKLKSVQQLVDVMKKNNFAPFTITKAWYGVNGNIGKNSIDVQAIMQSYADRGIFPDPDVEVVRMRAEGKLSAAQKALPQEQMMNVFFGADPKKKEAKVLHVEFTTRSLTDGVNGYVIEIPEWKNKRGKYDALPFADGFPVAPEAPVLATPSVSPENQRAIEEAQAAARAAESAAQAAQAQAAQAQAAAQASGASAAQIAAAQQATAQAAVAAQVAAATQAALQNVAVANQAATPLTSAQMGAVSVAAPSGELQKVTKINPNDVAWPADGVITLQQLGDALVKNSLQPFTIVDAWYGVQGNAKNITDLAKTKLQAYADKGIFTVPKNMNNFFGKDPVKGSTKTLYIKFIMQGRTYEISIPENKKDRGNYELPTARTIFAWGQGKTPGVSSVAWVRGDNLDNAISNAVAGRNSILSLDGLTYEDRLNNAFNILGTKSSEKEKNLFMSEATYLVDNRVLGDSDDLELLGALLKYARVPLSGDTVRLAAIADLAKKAGVDLTASNYIDVLQALLPLNTVNRSDFLSVGQKLVDMSKNNKLTYEEATKVKGILYAASLMLKNDQATVNAIKALDAAVMIPAAAVPGSTTPVVEQAPTATAAPTTTQAPAPVTYANRIDAAMNISSFANDTAKDDFLTMLDGLVADRAHGSDDNLTVLQGLISFYSSVSPFFKDDARQARLKNMLTTFNSGITYASRLAAVDPLVKAATLSDGQKVEMFNILNALAKEQAKASATELSVARANLIVAGSKYTSDADKAALASIESVFNTPPAPTVAPATQAAQAAAVASGVTTSTATADQAAGAAVSAQVVAAATGTAPVVAMSPRYSDRLMNGFGTLVAAKTTNTDEAITAALKILSGIVDDRYLAAGDDKKSLDMLIQFATMNFSDPKYADQIKTIAANAGTDIGFATKLQKFNEMMMNPNFVTSVNYQKDTLRLAQNLVDTVDKTSQNDVINLKASLMAAQRQLINAADALAVQNMQQGISIATVSSNALPAATTPATPVDTTSFKSRVAAAAAVTTFATDADKDVFINQIEGLVNDRARGSEDDIKALNTILDAAGKNTALGQTSQDRIKGFVATMSRPITSSERVAEQEEMTAMTNISSAQLAEVVSNMSALAKDIANISANDLVRIKSHLVVFAPRITDPELKKQFDAAKAIFDAPVQVVAPVAAVATGAAVPTAVATSTAGQAAVATAVSTTSRRVAPTSRARTATTQQAANIQKQLDSAKSRLASAKTSAQKKSFQRQVDSLTAKLQKMQVQESAATTTPAAVVATPVVATTVAVAAPAAVTPSAVEVAPAATPVAQAAAPEATAAVTPVATATPAAAVATPATTPAPAAVVATSTKAPTVAKKLTPSQVSTLKNRLSYYQKSVVSLTDRLAKVDPASASAKAMQVSIDRYNTQIKSLQDQLGITPAAPAAVVTPVTPVAAPAA